MFNVMPSTAKVMLIMFLDSQGVLLDHFQKHGENANSASYCEVLLEALECNSQKISRPTGKRGTSSS
jgi:hypothetical protein